MTSTPTDDAARLWATRSPRLLGEDAEIADLAESPDEVLLLVHGCALLSVETPLGPHAVATVHAPGFLNLPRALAGTTGLCRFAPAPETEALVFASDEARRLLFAAEEDGQAFRRLSLGSVTTILRETNVALSRFFDDLKRPGDRERLSREADPARLAPQNLPVDPGKVYDLFDAAGLNPTGLPDLGLVARRIPKEAPLVTAGAAAEEAFLLAEGRLRVSIRIPGVGEEALAILGPGEIVGEMALVDDSPRSADVRAHEGEALVFVLSRAVFRDLLDSGRADGAPLLAGIAIALARRLEESLRKTATFRVLAGPF
ncbi:cyclic nucleotide-binding domain-containing protein [Acidobacteria bacterium ACD]|nr:MAG: hypothetical protein EDX89_15695 [Acidobacteriota bacterium]MCE7960756.1 hypothetical protein [Acidobacteria bacterium ACB2]MDL1950770.1 cyclic nucleotide-binding domain-containing protein [Acidobacteria bacterium ACD]